MKFDKRISSDLRDVYTLYCRNNDNLLGIEVYASNDIDDFNNIDRCRKGKVEFIDAVHGYAVKVDSENTCYFNFVIPAMCVREKKKTLRAFTIQEFQNEFNIGNTIRFRRKENKATEYYQMLLGYAFESEFPKRIIIGCVSYTLQELFEDYEFKKEYDNDYRPFGVEE